MRTAGARAPGVSWSPWHEARVTWLFLYRDLSASVIPAALFTLSAGRYFDSSAGHLLTAFGQVFVWLVLYLYTFCLANQLTGIEEDRLLKPDRPLPRGLVTPRGVRARWAVAMPVFTLLGWWLGVLPYTLLWQAATVLHNFCGWGAWGFSKNLVMMLGVVAQLGAAWTLVGPVDATAWRWILVLTVLFVGPAVHIQDLRDLDGDRRTGRRTLPLLFGEEATRRYLSVFLFLVPAVLWLTLYAPLPSGPRVAVCGLAVTAACWTIAWRVRHRRGRRADHTTYMGYTYIYCLILASGMLVF
ncbi:UbiA family prenyltransferase [Streptomyces sp. NPDC046203]|uniref:UbiA family prenyltransferase n=1 Tax=Streptomyces sp. NPDC046203 TaxID=3154602 RepID=UPI0033D729E8